MSQFEQLITGLVSAAHDSPKLEKAYAAWIKALLRSPLWSPATPDGKKIPWRAAEAAKNHPSMQAAFGSPGLYLFGSAAGIPRYLGETGDRESTGTLGKRLGGRYVGGPLSEFQLAATYHPKHINDFPPDILNKTKKLKQRREHAVDFTKHGIEGIWIALIPVANKERVRLLEQKLIRIVNEWNISKRYPKLLNEKLQ